MKKALSCLTMLVLLTSQMAFGQTKPTPKEVRAQQYQKLFDFTSGLFTQIQKRCRTEACTQAAADGLALITDAQEKQKNGELSEYEPNRKEFHKKLEDVLVRARSALVENEAAKSRAKGSAKLNLPQSCPAISATSGKGNDGKLVPVQDEGDRCEVCLQTLHDLAEICALYAFVNPDAALICLAAAALGYAHCIGNLCGGPHSDFNDN